MDLNRIPNDQKLYLCKVYFIAGFFCLPFVWLVNACWFYEEAFKKPLYDEQKQIRNYVIWSAVGTVLWAAVLISWVTVYQINRASWGAFGDDISFIIPLGRP